MIRFAKVISQKVVKGIVNIILSAYTSDEAQAVMVVPSGYEGTPLANDKGLLVTTDKTGKMVCVGIPLESDLSAGLVRITARESDGAPLSQIFMKEDSTIEMGLSDFKRLVNEEFQDLFNNHKHQYLIDGVPTATGTPISTLGVPAVITDNELTSKVKAE